MVMTIQYTVNMTNISFVFISARKCGKYNFVRVSARVLGKYKYMLVNVAKIHFVCVSAGVLGKYISDIVIKQYGF